MFRRQSLRTPARRRAVLIEAVEPRQHMDADNTITGATSLSSVATYVAKSGSINKSSDASDFYKFTVPSGNKDFKLKLSGLTNNADLYLYNSSKTQINSSKVSGTGSESITKTSLAAGTYYAEVRAVSSSSNYTLRLAADFTGDSREKARDLGTLTNPKFFNEYVGSLDTGDYYKFKVAANSGISFYIDGLSADANLELLDSGGNSLAKSSKTGTAGDSIYKVLKAGTYYAKVVPASSSVDTSYNLSFAVPVKNAVDVGTLGGTTKTFTGKLDSTNKGYEYTFKVTGDGVLEADLSGLTSTAELRLYDTDGYYYGASIGTGTRHITSGLVSGTYTLKVLGYNSTNTNFKLTMVKNPVPDIDAGGNTEELALLKLDKSGNATVTGTILNRFNYDDAYVFDTTDPGPIYAYVYGMTAGAKVYLVNFDTDDTVAEADYNLNGGTATIAYTPTEAGSWYIVIAQGPSTTMERGPATHYTLQVHAPQDTGGNTLYKATPITSPFTVSNRVGSFDPTDYYKINVPNNSYITMTISTQDNFVAMQFLDANGTVVDTVAASKGNPNEMTYFLHTGGVRYVSVLNYNSYISNYSLSVKTQAF